MNIAVIPARLHSKRFPGKVLSEINGKTILQHLYERLKDCISLDKIYIATCDREIFNRCNSFTRDVVLTPEDLPTGSDRVGYIAKDIDAEIIANIQADQAFLKPSLIDEMITFMKNNPDIDTLTPATEISDPDIISNPNTVKVVIDENQYALYFSRSPIPYERDKTDIKYYKHIGIYIFRKPFLMKYISWERTPLETAESLEQLRILEKGYKIKIYLTRTNWESLDTPEDLERIRRDI